MTQLASASFDVPPRLNSLFSNVRAVLSLNSKFLSDLYERVTSSVTPMSPHASSPVGTPTAAPAMLDLDLDTHVVVEPPSPTHSVSAVAGKTGGGKRKGRRMSTKGGKGRRPVGKAKSPSKPTNNAKPDIHVGDLLLSFAPFFKLYIDYVNQHGDVNDVLMQIR